MDNIFEVLKKAIENKHSGFETADFSMLGDHEPSQAELEELNETYKKMILDVESGNVKQCGEGRHKTGFFSNGKIILKSDVPARPASESFYRALALRKMGVKIAMPLFEIHENELKNIGNGDYYYQVQEMAPGSFMSAGRVSSLTDHISSCSNDPFLFDGVSRKKLLLQYNTQMAMHRAKAGLPHLNQLFTLCRSLIGTSHEDVCCENINFSSFAGYTSFDLNHTKDLNSNDNIVEQLKNILKNTSSATEDYCYRVLFSQVLGIDNICAGVVLRESDKPTLMQKVFHTKKPTNYLNNENFPLFVYNGIITHQTIETMKNAPKMNGEQSNKTHAKKFAEKMENKLNTNNTITEGTFAMGSNMLMSLENALLSDNKVALHAIAKEFNLPEDFDFSCIDIPYFLETMKATHEFDFAHPENAKFMQGPPREHLSVCKNDDGKLAFGLV